MGGTCHIVGGGISGLFCAKFIKESRRGLKTVVYEASDKPGGRVFSYDDKDLNCRLDNATHVIIGANKYLRPFVQSGEWHKKCFFWDVQQDTLSDKIYPFIPHIIKSACNTPAEDTAPAIVKQMLKMTFPWTPGMRKIYFSQNDLSQRLINPLCGYADELRLNSRLMKIESQFGRAAALVFGNTTIDIGADDTVILALGSRAYYPLMGGPVFDYSGIVNIFFRTSQPLSLPRGNALIAAVNGKADWFFVCGNILAVTISAANPEISDLEQLARDVWKELDILRGVSSAFVPPFKVFHHKTATIRQDSANNAKRPDNAGTKYPNVFIAGDWTMKDYPCCMETSALSARRAVKTALKANNP